MTNIDLSDGGPAFPGQGLFLFSPGMSLRAWLAGQAMNAFILLGHEREAEEDCATLDEIAGDCVRVADFVLAELNRPRAVEAPLPSTPDCP